VRAVVGASPGEEDAADGGSADEAGLAGAQVDAMLELEEAGNAVGVDVIGDGRAPQFDGLAQDGLQGGVQPIEAGASEASGHARGADSGVEEAFVGVDVADAMEKLLVEQGGFDGELSMAKEGCEVGRRDGEGLAAGSAEGPRAAGVVDGVQSEAAEAAGVDEAEFAAGTE